MNRRIHFIASDLCGYLRFAAVLGLLGAVWIPGNAGAVEKGACNEALIPGTRAISDATSGIFESNRLLTKSFFQSRALAELFRGRSAERRIKRGAQRQLDANAALIQELALPVGPPLDKLERIIKGARVLSTLEVNRLQREISQADAWIAKLDARIAEQVALELPLLLAYAREHALQDSWRGLFEDHLEYVRVTRLSRKLTVSLLASQRHWNEVRYLARELRDQGYTVIYDADDSIAPALSVELGDAGVGISARSVHRDDRHVTELSRTAPQGRVITIQNDYLRMLALAQGGRTVVSPDSVAGAALLVHLGADAILDPESRWKDSFRIWADELESSRRGLGLAYPVVPSYASADEILKAQQGDGKGGTTPLFEAGGMESSAIRTNVSQENRQFAFQTGLDGLYYDELLESLEYVHGMQSGMAQLNDGPAGAVIFGAGTLSEQYNALVFRSASGLGQMGIPITTGGAGGFMRVANAGAFASGAPSIGIFIGGRDQLSSETQVYRDVQTQSIGVAGYSARIPLLLWNRPLVVLVPGRSGTMKELAVTLLKLNAHPDQPLEVVLVGREYYQGLDRALQQLQLPRSILDRISVVDNPKELVALVKAMVAAGRIDRTKLLLEGPVQARHLTPFQLDFREPKDQRNRSGKKGKKGK